MGGQLFNLVKRLAEIEQAVSGPIGLVARRARLLAAFREYKARPFQTPMSVVFNPEQRRARRVLLKSLKTFFGYIKA
jgi:hypothetical protein